jgi:hypothetical protein
MILIESLEKENSQIYEDVKFLIAQKKKLAAAEKVVKEIKKTMEESENRVKEYMLENEHDQIVTEIGTNIISYKEQAPRFDSATFKKEHASLYEEFKTSIIRMFKIHA